MKAYEYFLNQMRVNKMEDEILRIIWLFTSRKVNCKI